MKENIPKHQFSTKSTELFPLTLGQIEVLELHKTNMLELRLNHKEFLNPFSNEFLDVCEFIHKNINQIK